MGVRDTILEAYAEAELDSRVFTAGGGSEAVPTGLVGFELLGIKDWLFTSTPGGSITDYQWELYVYDGHDWFVLDDSATNTDFVATAQFAQNYYVGGWLRGYVRVLNSTTDDTRFTSIGSP